MGTLGTSFDLRSRFKNENASLITESEFIIGLKSKISESDEETGV